MPLTAYDQRAEFAPSRYWSAPVPLNEAMAAPLAPVEFAINAYVNHGRWVVGCPDCNGAQIASSIDYRFMCTECGNAGADGMWRAVIWPEEHAEIDALLTVRPLANQNWLPGETLADLTAESATNGVGA